jgi:uroporphyrinogen-III synthase
VPPGITIDYVDFIAIRYPDETQLVAQLQSSFTRPVAAIFTSSNAVKAVQRQLDGPPAWNALYCLSGITAKLASQAFPQVPLAGTAPAAAELAERIKAAEVPTVHFYCGDLRLDVLPGLLQEAGIAVTEYVVYETQLTPVRLQEAYDAIVFYSPSGAASFFSVNNSPSAVLFAIGRTTAAAVQQYTSGEVITSREQSKQGLLQQAIDTFKA